MSLFFDLWFIYILIFLCLSSVYGGDGLNVLFLFVLPLEQIDKPITCSHTTTTNLRMLIRSLCSNCMYYIRIRYFSLLGQVFYMWLPIAYRIPRNTFTECIIYRNYLALHITTNRRKNRFGEIWSYWHESVSVCSTRIYLLNAHTMIVRSSVYVLCDSLRRAIVHPATNARISENFRANQIHSSETISLLHTFCCWARRRRRRFIDAFAFYSDRQQLNQTRSECGEWGSQG